jgi:predicted Zn-dependent protease with MMP-like domain
MYARRLGVGSSTPMRPSVPTTKKSIFDLPTGPDHIVLYQKNIEAVCSSEAEVREQIRLTVIHELGHYFGMDENQLKDV